MKPNRQFNTCFNTLDMRLFFGIAASILLFGWLLAVDAEFVGAEEFCVTNSAQLESALQKAAINGQSDLIKIYQDALLGQFTIPNEPGFTIAVRGGYNYECLTREIVRTPPAPLQGQLPGTSGEKDQASPENEPPPARSTTGPSPPPGVDFSQVQTFDGQELAAAGGAISTISVPAYSWRHGCGPTALGMVLGYYDINGFADLFDGSALTQTSAIDQGIASERDIANPGHYEDYSLPIDNGEQSPLTDVSESPGNEHGSDSIADFMETSFSSRGNFYGWSWSSDIQPAFNEYVALRNGNYLTSSTQYNTISNLWPVLVSEIDRGSPMVFLVDTDGNGGTDHFVTVIGYDDSVPTRYACWDTWDTGTVRWQEFAAMGSGVEWGIWGGWSFSLVIPGDIYYDAVVDLKDVIAGLQVLVNKPVGNVIDEGDVDGDKRVGLQEIIYDLNQISEQSN